jgi:hypothetical protein
MTDSLDEYVVDLPEQNPRTIIIATSKLTADADHTSPPAIQLQVATLRDGIEVSILESLLDEDMDRLIEALTGAWDQAVEAARATGHYAWVEAGRPARWRPGQA